MPPVMTAEVNGTAWKAYTVHARTDGESLFIKGYSDDGSIIEIYIDKVEDGIKEVPGAGVSAIPENFVRYSDPDVAGFYLSSFVKVIKAGEISVDHFDATAGTIQGKFSSTLRDMYQGKPDITISVGTIQNPVVYKEDIDHEVYDVPLSIAFATIDGSVTVFRYNGYSSGAGQLTPIFYNPDTGQWIRVTISRDALPGVYPLDPYSFESVELISPAGNFYSTDGTITVLQNDLNKQRVLLRFSCTLGSVEITDGVLDMSY